MESLENALVFHQSGDLTKAIAAYEEALRHDPCNTVALNNFGVALCEMQQYDRGISVFAEVLKHEPNDAETHFNLGNAYLLIGNVRSACGTLRYAAGLSPDDKEIQVALADATNKLEKQSPDFVSESICEVDRQFTILPKPSEHPANPEELRHSDKPDEKSNPIFHKPSRQSLSKTHEWNNIFERIDKIEGLYKHYGFEVEHNKLQDKRRHLADTDVLVFIIGEGNFGKSSLINAILGRDVADVNLRPKTWCIHLYRTQDSGRDEFAEIRRYENPATECVSIANAKKLCEEQEEQVLARADEAQAAHKRGEYSSAQAVAFPGQIIEVNWYYHDLKCDPNIVLVDTPGFAQFRAGLNEARTEVISSHKGVVFDIAETYEHYYSHADLVLWAFAANKINDRDTINAICDMSQHTKPVTGIITKFDRVPLADRDETLRIAKKLYGAYVADFVSVVAGGKSEERGLGIPDLRTKISEVSRTAIKVKLDSGYAFCHDAARFSNKWLKSIGDTLIRNVSEVAQYCNLTSDRLLRDTYKSQQAGLDEFEKRLISGSGFSAFQAFLLNVIESRVTTQEKQQQISDYLKVDTLRAQMQMQLDQVGKFLVVEGQREARAHQLHQVIVKATGKTEIRPLEAIIEPPDVSRMGLSLEGMALPEVANGFMDGLLELFDGSFLGAVASFFGGRSKEERQREAVLKAQDQIQSDVRKQITDGAKGYAMAGAKAILATAEDGLSKIYGGKGFTQLQKEAERIDRDMKQMLEILGQETGEGTHYQSLFRTLVTSRRRKTSCNRYVHALVSRASYGNAG